MAALHDDRPGQKGRGPADLRAFMDQAGIQGMIIELPVETPTVAAAAQALGVPVDAIVKSILFIIEPDEAVLAVAPGRRRVSISAIAAWLGTSRTRIRLASPEEALQLCGYQVGAVPPFGHQRELPVCMDRALIEMREIYAGGGSLNSLLKIDPAEIARVTRADYLELVEPTDRL